MGRNAAVTYEQVCAAAAALRAAGKTAGAKAIRQMLGDVGSLGTIQKLLQRTLAEESAQPTATRMLPPELQRAVFKFADEEVARINTELAAELDHCKREIADVAKDNELQGEHVTQLLGQLEGLNATKAELDGRVSQLIEEVVAARNETARERREAELARTELAKEQLRLEALAPLGNELRELRADFERQREACVRAEQAAAVLTAQKTDLEQRLAELKSAPLAIGADGDGRGQTNESADLDKRPPPPPSSPVRDPASEHTTRPQRTSAVAPSDESIPDDLRQPKLC